MESVITPAAAAGGGGGSSDWTELLEDVLLIVMEQLDILDLVRSSAVCATWRDTSAAVRRARFPLPSSEKQLPCLFYASEAYAPDVAAVHCPFTGESVRVSFPLAPVAKHSMVSAGHGWIVTADEASNLHLVNPITGAQASLPPITGLYHVETIVGAGVDDALMYNVFLSPDPEPLLLTADEAWECMYHRVVFSCSPSAGAGAATCIALLAHMDNGELSFARLGDDRWTWISPDEHPCLRRGVRGFVDFFHDDDDGLFYALRLDGSIYTLDLNGDPPIVRQITGKMPQRWLPAAMYILRAPWGDILQVRRWRSYVDLMETETPSSEHPVNLEVDDEDLEPNMDISDDIYPYLELRTTDIEVFKVDFDRKKLVKMKSLDDHALFLGYNATMCLSTKDYPILKPNCAYITDDSFEYISGYKNSWREIGIWDMKNKSLQSFTCAQDSPPWLNSPSPVWIKPSLF